MKTASACLPFLILLATIAVVAPDARAQSSSLSGVVTDETGGILPDAEITVINQDNNVQRTVVSNEEGLYVFAQLPPGSYHLSATQPGFNSVTIEGITLLVNTNLELPVVFDTVATLTRSITVSATAPQLNTTDASVGNAFGTKPIRQLPLNARNPAGLLSLQAGVTFLTADPLDSKLSGDIRNGTVNGAQSDQSNVTLDGVDVNDQNGRLPFTSVLRNTLDSIQEFRVVTTTANANQGRSSGAQVSLVTKSGTNEVHGSLYEYHRNTITAANDFFNNRAGVDRPKLIRNVFGGSVGGPVKKDRVFYFLNYEGRRDASDGSAVRRVPTASMRDGFVRYRSVDGQVQTLDPAFIRKPPPRVPGTASRKWNPDRPWRRAAWARAGRRAPAPASMAVAPTRTVPKSPSRTRTGSATPPSPMRRFAPIPSTRQPRPDVSRSAASSSAIDRGRASRAAGPPIR